MILHPTVITYCVTFAAGGEHVIDELFVGLKLLYTKTELRCQIISLTGRAHADNASLNCCAAAAVLCSRFHGADAQCVHTL